MALTMTSEPQPPSWQGVWDKRVSRGGRVKHGHVLLGARARAADPRWRPTRRRRILGKTYRGAGLDEELANRSAVIHGVERGDLVDTHGGHLE